MKLGCCYYPEHWPEQMWAGDAARMASLGISYVRIGEFAWSRIEPEPGQYDWGWLDRAVSVLANANLKIIMGTPTATPPKWLIDAYPDILPCDQHRHPRTFGSRRHYSFSSKTYLRESARIIEAMSERYGNNLAIVMWQTDNEYGCHDTVESNDDDAREAFRLWLKIRYETIGGLNDAWGCVFWSQEYRSFDEIDPPLATVTEPNPSHVLDWRRFSSDQVAAYNQMQIDILRRHSPERDITHNFMGHFTEFDHYPVGRQIDVSTWDSYPLGFLEQAWWEPETKTKYARTGHPDFAAFHHDLYRGMSNGRWGIMEQQPGPVNWARNNPAPLDGMVALWTLEAVAHGAEFVSYFRWRQAPFAQEQMHAGLNRPDNVPDTATYEATAAMEIMKRVGALAPTEPSHIAMIFDYEAMWMFETHAQGQGFRYDVLAFKFYSALRRLGYNIDIIGPDAPIDGYKLIIAPSLPMISETQAAKYAASDAQIIFGPRSGSKTLSLQVPNGLAPGWLAELLGLKIWRVESFGAGVSLKGEAGGKVFKTEIWREFAHATADVELAHDDGSPAAFRNGKAVYLPVWPDEGLLDFVLARASERAGLQVRELPDGLRLRRRGGLIFAVNYGESVDLEALGLVKSGDQFLAGSANLPRAGVSIWRE